MDWVKLTRAAVGVVVVAILFGLVANYIGNYREATRAGGSASSSGTATPTPDGSTPSTSAADSSEPEASAQVLIVAVDGLNFRKEPSGQSRAMRGLSKGEKLTLLATEGDWFKVRDGNNVVGYITSNPAYTDVAK